MQYHDTYNHAFVNFTFLDHTHTRSIFNKLTHLHCVTRNTSIPSHGAYSTTIFHLMSMVKVGEIMHLKHHFEMEFLLQHQSNVVHHAHLWTKLSS